jgi:lactoylglutathione lyase
MGITTGLFETHLTVADLARSTAFYRDVVGLPVALELPERGAAFLWIGAPGRAMLGLWSMGSAPMGLRLHLAFSAALSDVLAAPAGLRAAGITPLSFDGDETDEPSVLGWMPAAAVYFRDPDDHQVEYLAMLDEPPRPEAGIVPWSAWAPAPGRVEIRRHDGDRATLRPSFEQAEDSTAALDAYIDHGEVLVALLGGEVVGHLQLIGREVRNMAVSPAYRGRGIGRALLDAAGPSLTVATAAADIGNLRFYQRCGFRLTTVERDVFTPEAGYAPGIAVDGIPLLDRVWLRR